MFDDKDIEYALRTLAKSNKYQTLYNHAREGGFQFFTNHSDYTGLQITFLDYLNFYHNLYTEIALKTIDIRVLENFIFEEAFMYYHNKCKDKNTEKLNQDSRLKEDKVETQRNISWVFKSKDKVK